MRRRLCLLAVLGTFAVLSGAPSALAGGGCHGPMGMEMTSESGDTAVIAECSFSPTVLYVEPGDRVTWSNKDFSDHTVTGAAFTWGSERPLAQGDTISFAFKEEGVFPYYCAYHPAMVGAVVVGDATAAADLNAGAAAIDEVRSDSDGGASAINTTSAVETESTLSPALVALGALAVIAIAGLAWRTLLVRRREPSAIPAP